MKHIISALALTCVAVTGCTTYPQNYTYSPTVSVGGDNQGGIVLPSPYAKKPQPVPQIIQAPPVSYQEDHYDSPRYSSSDYYQDDDTPIYVTNPNVRVMGPDGYYR